MSVKSEYQYSDLTGQIIKIAIDIHKNLGPGFVEKIYQRALYLEFKNSKFKFAREKKILVNYKNINIGYETVDFDVEERVLVEVKAVSMINEIHLAQVLSYLKSSGRRVGLILNFARSVLEIKRVVS